MNGNQYAERPGIITKLQLNECTYTVEFREHRRVIEVEHGVKEEAIKVPEFDKQAVLDKDTKVEVDPIEVAKIIQGASARRSAARTRDGSYVYRLKPLS